MIQPGTEWMVRALANAADGPVEGEGLSTVEKQRALVYSGAVADVLRLLLGDLDLESAPPVLQDIYRRYQASI